MPEKCDDCGKEFAIREPRFTFSSSTTDVEQHYGPFCKKCRLAFIRAQKKAGARIEKRYSK